MPLCLLIYVRCVPSLIFRLLERPSWACKLLSVPSWSAPHNKGGFKGQKVSRLLIVLFDFFFHLIFQSSLSATFAKRFGAWLQVLLTISNWKLSNMPTVSLMKFEGTELFSFTACTLSAFSFFYNAAPPPKMISSPSNVPHSVTWIKVTHCIRNS